MPEVANVLQNLSGIDDEQTLARMMKLGLPQAILTLLAQFYKKSIVITHCCLDSLMNLVCSFMDDQLAQACIAQITLFSAEN